MKTDVKGRSGFKRRLEPNANEAEVVRTIFKLAIFGDAGEPWGIKKIATELNRRGETMRGKEWRRQMVWIIVTSTTYYGEHIFNRRDSRSGELREDGEWVVTKIPPIVSKEDWDKAAALRAERAPGGSTEHRAASSPTLLTGLAKCAHCGGGFVLETGKGGHYKYYRCSTRLYKGVDKCDAPTIPLEELDAAVLNVIAEKVLQPDRILAMLEQLREQIAKLQAPDREREKLIQRQMALATEQINTWYALVEEGKAEMHESLRERLTAAQRRIDQMTSELLEISRRRQLPLKQFGETQVQGFAEAIRTEVLAPGSKFAKGYLRALVSEIRISAAGATMKGSNADMAGAISGWRPGNPNLAVPRHVSNWRGGRIGNAWTAGGSPYASDRTASLRGRPARPAGPSPCPRAATSPAGRPAPARAAAPRMLVPAGFRRWRLGGSWRPSCPHRPRPPWRPRIRSGATCAPPCAAPTRTTRASR